jgi:hypothetical protein
MQWFWEVFNRQSEAKKKKQCRDLLKEKPFNIKRSGWELKHMEHKSHNN